MPPLDQNLEAESGILRHTSAVLVSDPGLISKKRPPNRSTAEITAERVQR
jgi:hypothetical protein